MATLPPPENLKVKKGWPCSTAPAIRTPPAWERPSPSAEKLGLEVVDKESSSSADDTEYSAQLQKIQASGAELLYAPYYYSVAGPYTHPAGPLRRLQGYVMGPDGYDG
mgnify:CR=1 FL=1